MDRYEIYHFYAKASCFNTKSKGLKRDCKINIYFCRLFFKLFLHKNEFFLNNSFTPERIIYVVVLTLESADEIRWCDHLNECSFVVLFASPNFIE